MSWTEQARLWANRSIGARKNKGGLLGSCAAMDPAVVADHKRQIEAERARIHAEVFGRQDDRDEDPRDAIGCVGFGHAPPILGGPSRDYFFSSFSGHLRDINDPAFLLAAAEACRIYIREARRKGWIGRRGDKQQVA